MRISSAFLLLPFSSLEDLGLPRKHLDSDWDPGEEEMQKISGPQKVTCPYSDVSIPLSYNSNSMQPNSGGSVFSKECQKVCGSVYSQLYHYH